MNFAKRARDNFFTLNGRSSADWDIVCSSDTAYNAPARDVKAIQVPGRNGELHIDNGRWQNVDLTYNDCVIESDFGDKFDDFRAYCTRQRGYQRLEDTFHPDEYRLADMTQGIKVKKLGTRYNSGRFDLTFNCKPQRFLKSGEEPITIIPPYILANTVRTPTFTGAPDIDHTTITVLKFPANHSGIALTWEYGQEGGTSSTYSLGTATGEGWSCTFPYAIPPDYLWRIEASIGDNDSFDDFILAIDGTFLINGKRVNVNALCGRSIELYNPTGFETSPYIECDGAILGVQSIRNYDADGNMTETWKFTATDYSAQTTSAIIDCENEYLYYVDSNGKKQNITGHITLEHVDGAGDDLPLTFPKLGGEKTLFYSYVSYAYRDLFVRIYPRWYTI